MTWLDCQGASISGLNLRLKGERLIILTIELSVHTTVTKEYVLVIFGKSCGDIRALREPCDISHIDIVLAFDCGRRLGRRVVLLCLDVAAFEVLGVGTGDQAMELTVLWGLVC